MSAVVTLLSAGEAQRLTQRIKLTAGSIRDGLFKLRNLVDEAKASNAWQVLGFASWTAYLADALGSEPMRVNAAERQELVSYLSGEGMPSRAIAPIAGVTDRRVRQIAREVGSDFPPAASVSSAPEAAEPVVAGPVEPSSPEAPRPATEPNIWVEPSTGEVIEAPVVTEHTVTEKTKTVTGLDGKTYTTKPPVERRSSILDDARNTGWQLRKAVERLERIREDDRFTKNKAEILAALQPHLDFANEVISDL